MVEVALILRIRSLPCVCFYATSSVLNSPPKLFYFEMILVTKCLEIFQTFSAASSPSHTRDNISQNQVQRSELRNQLLKKSAS